MYPTGVCSPKFYSLPKIYKNDIPLRPIVSSRSSATYGVAKELASILQPSIKFKTCIVNNQLNTYNFNHENA